ncbi:ankyrin repeat-containing domain, PGG domain protein, partial [Tanacetum coccineum]
VAFVCPKEGHRNIAMLRIIWKDIVKKPKKVIDDMIRGSADVIKKDDRFPCGKEEQQLHLLKLIVDHEVESMIPPSYRERKNKDGLTPHLFTKEHKDRVTKGEEWMKGTTNQCMVVAALIATIVFAAS